MMFHDQFAPAKKQGICDRCESVLFQRKDDLPDVIEQRIKIYNKTTQPVVNFYADRGLLIRIGIPAEIINNIPGVKLPLESTAGQRCSPNGIVVEGLGNIPVDARNLRANIALASLDWSYYNLT